MAGQFNPFHVHQPTSLGDRSSGQAERLVVRYKLHVTRKSVIGVFVNDEFKVGASVGHGWCGPGWMG